MELRRAADAVLRTQSAPLSSCLTPRSTIRWTTSPQLSSSSSPFMGAQRYISSTSRRHALLNIPTTTSAAQQPAKPSPTTSNPSSAPSTPENDKPAPTLDSLANDLWAKGGNRSRSSVPPPRASGLLERTLNGGSSSSDLLSSLKSYQEKRRNPWGKMLDPPSKNSDPLGKDLMSFTAEETMVHKTIRPPVKLGPSTGRTVSVGASGIDLPRGLRLLEQACARNKIRKDVTQQRFHERPGMKRKRLGRQRWRRKFLEGFKATIERVKALKNQGW